jgi:DeoR/GlpR family transcriptional regulator of sugar metabolism
MDIQQIVKEIKLHKKHGIVSQVSARTGISMPTVRKYLNGDVKQPKVLLVLNTAIDIINESNI